MAMVDVSRWFLPIIGGLTVQVGWLDLRVGDGHPVLCLHSSNEPDKLSQWLTAQIVWYNY